MESPWLGVSAHGRDSLVLPSVVEREMVVVVVVVEDASERCVPKSVRAPRSILVD